MSETKTKKTLKTRIQMKQDSKEHWEAAATASKPFIPLGAELIVYTDGNGDQQKPRLKIGDGQTNVEALPFATPVIDTEGSVTVEKNLTVNYNTQFGDHVQALGTTSHSEGYYSIANTRGYTILQTSEDGKTLYLDSVEGIELNYTAYASILDNSDASVVGWRPATIGRKVIEVGTNYIKLDSAITDYAGQTLLRLAVNGNAVVNGIEKTVDDSRLSWKVFFEEAPELGTSGVSGRSHSEGRQNKAFGDSSHAEGRENTSFGDYTHVEGRGNKATAEGAHAEGWQTQATGDFSHSEGYQTKSTAIYAHAEGKGTTASGNYSHAEGESSKASGIRAHAEGEGCEAQASGSHAEGGVTKVLSNAKYGHSEGLFTEVSGTNGAHAEGNKSKAVGETSHAEGNSTRAYGLYSHAEGEGTIAGVEGKAGDTGRATHAEGRNTVASGAISHAEGDNSKATNYGSHAEGIETTASGSGSHSEGQKTQATSTYSHAEGYDTLASGTKGSHAEGYSTVASGENSHAEGRNTVASGAISHAEGDATTANGTWAHSEGRGTIASGNYQHVQGKYNVEDTENKYAHIVGNGTGTSVDERSNAHTIDWEGNACFAGEVTSPSFNGRLNGTAAFIEISGTSYKLELSGSVLSLVEQPKVTS